MATVSFEVGDTFNFQNGSGIVLPSGEALIIEGTGGRTGYQTKKASIPDDAIPGTPSNFEVTFALKAVRIAIK